MDLPATTPVPQARRRPDPSPDDVAALAEALQRLRAVEAEAASLGLDQVAQRTALLADLVQRLCAPPSTGRSPERSALPPARA